jgi:hypothetical protein
MKLPGQRQLTAEQADELFSDVTNEFQAKNPVVDMEEMLEDAASDPGALVEDELILEVEVIDESGIEGGTI